jgi:beta-glucosidase
MACSHADHRTPVDTIWHQPGPAHRKIARQAARESMVLLKNENRLLPLSKTIHSIALIGPIADNNDTQGGNVPIV